MVWFERKTTARQRCNVLNESNPTSYGRWISRGRKDGQSRSDLFRLLDDHNRLPDPLAANGSTHGEPVREQLQEAFQRCGVPEGILMDHGTGWGDNTQLSLWLMRQGAAELRRPLVDPSGKSTEFKSQYWHPFTLKQ